MKLTNRTALSAAMFRGEPRPEQMLAIIVVKTTHACAPTGLGPPLPDTPAPTAATTTTPLGDIPGDAVPYRPGTDIWVLGHAHTPRPVQAMTVTLEIGPVRRTLLVVGDRRWRADGTFSEPEPFERMPLSYARAYGGRFTDDAAAHVYPDNPEGRGFVPHAGGVGTLLPNIEWPDDRVTTWRCRPQIAGFAPVGGAAPMHVARSVVRDPEAPAGFRLGPAWFSSAHPRLILGALAPHTRVQLGGAGQEGGLAFTLPPAPARLVVVLGGRRHPLPLALDTIGIFADEGRVSLSWRASFRYALRRHEARAAVLEVA